MHPRRFVTGTVVGFLIAATTPNLPADDAEFHYVRPYGGRYLNWRPRESFAVVGGQFYSIPPSSQPQPPAPNTWLPFRHPYTRDNVIVPVALPAGIPRIVQHHDRLIYDYGFVSVVIHFVRDGSVNVSYDRKMP